jgi:hypothetical protein
VVTDRLIRGVHENESSAIPPSVSDCNGDCGEMNSECHRGVDWEEETEVFNASTRWKIA